MEVATMSLETIFANISKCPAAIRNNGGGYYNHTLPNGHNIPARVDLPENWPTPLIKPSVLLLE